MRYLRCMSWGFDTWLYGEKIPPITLINTLITSLFFFFFGEIHIYLGFPGGSDSKKSACNVGDPGLIPGVREDPEKEMATHSSILAWRTPWTEDPCWLQSMGSQRVGHDWVTNTHTHTHTYFYFLLQRMLQMLLAFKLVLIWGNLGSWKPENLQGLFLTAGSWEKGLFLLRCSSA